MFFLTKFSTHESVLSRVERGKMIWFSSLQLYREAQRSFGDFPLGVSVSVGWARGTRASKRTVTTFRVGIL